MKRIVSLLLAVLMLFGMVACGEAAETPSDESKDQITTIEDETENPNYVCDLPSDLDYNEEQIGILYIDFNNKERELISDELGQGVVSDAVFERNTLVQEQLNVVFEYFEKTEVTQVATAQSLDIQSGQGDYDIVVNGTFLAIQPALEGKYVELSELENMNTSKHYWSQGFNDMVTFSGIQYLASGSMAISMSSFTYVTLYNRNLFTDYKLPDPYETVTQGKWTLDYQYSLVKDHYVDKDGDSKASTGDFYGFLTDNIILVDPYMVSCEIPMIVKDPDTGDLTYNTAALQKLSDLCDKVQLLYNDESTFVYSYSVSGYGVDGTNLLLDHFAADNALMATTMFVEMERKYESLAPMSYGIAPIPKFDENQQKYRSYVQDQVSSFGISAVVGDGDRREMLAAVLEAMAYHSHILVRPAYYEVTLSSRYMQDPQSKEILDLIFDSLYFDFSSTCSNLVPACVIRDHLRPILSGKKNTVSSSTRSWERTVQRTLDKYNKSLAELVS